MSPAKLVCICASAFLPAWLSSVSSAQDVSPKPWTADEAREEEAYTIGVQAYIYGYPVVEMYRVRYASVFDPARKNSGIHLNQFLHVRNLLDHTATTVVAPNNDTLYSSAWLNLAAEPIILDVPDTAGRYYVMHFLDFYTNGFAFPGKRTTGTQAGSFAIVGPGWKGTLPAGVSRIDSPTASVWLIGRTLIDGPDDLATVHALQDQYKLTPLSRWGKSDSSTSTSVAPGEPPPFDLSEPLNFFESLNVALRENPPPEREAALMSLFGRIGVGPQGTLKVAELDAPTAQGLRRAIEAGTRIITSSKLPRPVVNGWLTSLPHHGNFGDDYLYRAVIAKTALAAMVPEENKSFSIRQAGGLPLSGANKYVLRFAPGQLPPVDAFWSVTMYQAPNPFLVDNPLGRYSIGDRTKGLEYGDDGSLEIYVQQQPPGADKVSNWLPAPSGDFLLALRCYLPQKPILDGSWKPPTVEMLK